MILDLVDQPRRMLQTHTDGQSLALDFHPVGIQPAVDVAGGMPRGQNHRPAESPPRVRLNPDHLVFLDEQGIHAGLEMHLSPAVQDGLAHVLYDPREFVRPDVGMRVLQDGQAGAVLAKHVQDFLHVATLLAPRVEFSVGISPRAALAETVVALAVHLVFARDFGQVQLAVAHVLSAFYDDGPAARLYQTKGGEESARPGSDHNHLRPSAHVMVFRTHELIVFRLLVDIRPHFQVHVNGALAGVDAPLQHPYGRQCPLVFSFLAGDMPPQGLLAGCRFRQYSELVFFYHNMYASFSPFSCAISERDYPVRPSHPAGMCGTPYGGKTLRPSRSVRSHPHIPRRIG